MCKIRVFEEATNRRLRLKEAILRAQTQITNARFTTGLSTVLQDGVFYWIIADTRTRKASTMTPLTTTLSHGRTFINAAKIKE
jgi:hypothetical protein